MTRVLSAFTTIGIVALVHATLGAQTLPTTELPQIVTSAEGETRVAPDRATISIGVQTRAVTAAQASAENARKQRAVIDTLRALGVTPDRMTTVDYNVFPEQSYNPQGGDKAPRIIGYNVVNTVRVETQKLDQVGTLIDAAIAKGANGINSLQFSATKAGDARHVALASALARARGDAEALARGAGGQLGDLLEVTTSSVMPPPTPLFRMSAARADAASTPVSPGEQSLTVTVMARWRFVAGAK